MSAKKLTKALRKDKLNWLNPFLQGQIFRVKKSYKFIMRKIDLNNKAGCFEGSFF